ncbi:FAD-dependent oxidoreductase [Paenibacillus sp. WQ 127069]|uniref:FAD-dependent oxidoreductase n=1 Tax=Paenibacillus baimaensis TaxID=2982185 RepID=A0ABT2UD36_9BACL|nr:FAD-dependent oxidoreductase [Paenibacillus sp. WQ 127069]MCU6792544.1 FAD-dependent oxidoreductase [Paenibacillus sp. WQ 127069]
MLILEKAREIPVFHEADVCVLGGSCTGVFAAVRAARLGAKVVIIEKQNAFGGVATSGLVNVWHTIYDTVFQRQIIAGMTTETIERLHRRDAVDEEQRSHSVGYVLNTEELKIELDELILEAGVKTYLHTMFVAPHVVDEELKGVIVENKSGRGAIMAKYFIDATGDGDLCARLGVEHRLSSYFQPSTMCAKIGGWGSHGDIQNAVTGSDQLKGIDLQKARLQFKDEFQLPEGFGWGRHVPGSRDVYMYAGTRVYHKNSADGEDLTYSEIEGRRQVRSIMDLVRKYGPDNNLSLVSLPSYIGTRETRHINCAYRLTGEDVLYGRRFDDAIANGSYRVDVHHQEKPGLTFKYLDGEQVYIRPGYPHEVSRWREPMEKDPTFYQIPYRSLLPEGPYRNVIVAGRMLDADEEAFGGVRVMVNMNQTGEAAGVAAYLALSQSKNFHELDTAEIRSTLVQGGSLII